MKARAFGWVEVACIAGLMLLLFSCGACATKAPSYRSGHWGTMPMHPDMIGVLGCGNDRQPIGWIRSDIARDSRTLRYTLAHEDAHAAQAALMGGCRVFREWYEADPWNRLQSEADAFCAMAQHGVRMGDFRTVRDAAVRFGPSLRHAMYGFELTDLQAENWIVNACEARR